MAGVRLSQIDYDRQMTLIAQLPGVPQMLGIARFSADPDNRLARLAVAVRRDVTAKEIGPLLITHLLAVARVRGIATVFGDIARDDIDAQAWYRSLVFKTETPPDDAELISVRRDVDAAGP